MMYEHFFGFTAKPFKNLHDADQYFIGASQQQTLDSIHEGLKKNGGFITITGPTGVGKTSIIEFLKKEQKESNLNIASISANKISDLNLLPTILTVFNCPIADLKLSVLISQIESFIHSQMKSGKKALLIIDDAEGLSNRCLDVLRLLSNFQSNGQASFQVVLVGRNELKTRLMDESLAALKKQVVASIEIQPMDLIATKNYVMHHLKRVGWNNNPKITGKLLELTFKETQGLPIAVNYFFDEYLKQEAEKVSEVASSVLEFPVKNKSSDYDKDELIAALEKMESQDGQDIICNAVGAEPPTLHATLLHEDSSRAAQVTQTGTRSELSHDQVQAASRNANQPSGQHNEHDRNHQSYSQNQSQSQSESSPQKQAQQPVQNNDGYNFDDEMSLEETKRLFEGGSGGSKKKTSDVGFNWKLVGVVFGSYALSAVIAVSLYFSSVPMNEFSSSKMIMAVEADASTVVSIH